FREFANVAATLGIEGQAVDTFTMLALEDDPERQMLRSRHFASTAFKQQPQPLPALARSGKIAVGYFTANFHDHPMAYLMAGMLREHDRNRFEIIAYCYDTGRESAMRDKIAQT